MNELKFSISLMDLLQEKAIFCLVVVLSNKYTFFL